MLDKCINFLVYHCPSEILYKKDARSLPISLIEEVIERSFKHSQNEKPDISLINLLLEHRKCKNIFQLLKSEEKKVITKDAELQFQDGPSLTWELTNFTDSYHKDSEPFVIDGHAFKLTIQYMGDSLQLKVSSVEPSQLKKLRNSSDLPIDFFQSYDPQPDNILSAMYKIEIGSFVMEEAGIASIFEDGTFKVELANIPDFEYEQHLEPNNTLRVQLYFKIKYTHSAILSQIAKNFNYYHTDESIKLLSADHLIFLFKFDFLEVMSEDQVLLSYVLWLQANNSEVDNSALSHILDNIRWNHVTMKTLHKVMISHKVAKDNADMRRIFKGELERRMRELLQDRDSSEMYAVYLHKNEPRKSYMDFLRPESSTFIFDYLFTQLLEVRPQQEIVRTPQNIDNSVEMVSKSSSVVQDFESRQDNTSVARPEAQRTRIRGNRQINKVEDYITPMKDEDRDSHKSSTDNNPIRNIPSETDKRTRINRLFDSRNSQEDEKYSDQDKHAYKGPPNMASFDIPNSMNDTANNPDCIGDPESAYNQDTFGGENSINMNNLFERKQF
mmetsp:Transcript_11318/g.11274  ORF Transcript_11318/g.11274 Transcript_11318/m.11274 type:complete len:556 (-) Transcript_11318:35-1702(-)|eukprot:CAMPEP_0197009310 /NCGR_PEP_ID=MMETSP1380-20130617/49554_1 /TAXON_ID=5936 /ORGANISM="Euplotes crassus, Strain CT5" /LENGTH=555 /DNA_ID=CAMNT_0042430467 /DNA_START=483 /DNA_END=2150 /DNA_ORIENTATION=+